MVIYRILIDLSSGSCLAERLGVAVSLSRRVASWLVRDVVIEQRQKLRGLCSLRLPDHLRQIDESVA